MRESEETIIGVAAAATAHRRAEIIGNLDLGTATWALEYVRSERAFLKLKYDLLSCVETGLAIPWTILYRLHGYVFDIYMSSWGYFAKRCCSLIFNPTRQIFKLFFKINIIVLERQQINLRRQKLLMSLDESLFEHLKFLRLVGGQPAAHGANHVNGALDGFVGGIDAGEGGEQAHGEGLSSCGDGNRSTINYPNGVV